MVVTNMLYGMVRCNEIVIKNFKGEFMDSLNTDTDQVRTIELASLSDRLAAALLDGVITGIIVLLPLFSIYGLDGVKELISKYGIVYALIMSVIGQSVYLLLNGKLLYKYGQTIGKRYIEIKIVTLDGNLPSIRESYVLRNLVVNCLNLIPLIGRFVSFVDVVFIFRKDRRCIHDLIAGTKVIEA